MSKVHEGEIVEERGLVIRERSSVLLMPVMDLNTAKARLQEFQEFCAHYLQESQDGGNDGGDYGVIPGTKKKTLLKSGADKLAEIYGLYDEYIVMSKVEEWHSGLFDYTLKCVMKSRRDDSMVGSGVGSCSSFESKYRWREEQRKCPTCNSTAIIKGKAEFGGGWLCWAKKGGCGAKFRDGDKSIEGQTIGRMENPDIIDTKNTVLKMAKKRAKIDAVIGVTRSSGIFTQDFEEIAMPAPAKPPVAITTEDIPLEKPRSAQSNKGQGESVLQRGNDSPASAETSARLPVKAQAVVDTPVPSPTSTVETPGLAAIPIPGADCIGTGEAANLHREFRNTLPKKFQKDADALLSDWLRVQTPPIVDVLGKPSALAIKKESFYIIRELVCEYARTF